MKTIWFYPRKLNSKRNYELDEIWPRRTFDFSLRRDDEKNYILFTLKTRTISRFHR